MKKLLIVLLALCVLMTAVAMAEETPAPLPDISTMDASQLKTLKTAINERLIALGEMYEDIGKGSQGENVTLLQERLKELGYLDGEPTNRWDKPAIDAMKAYEKATGAKADGLASASEQEAIFAADAMVKPTPEPTATPDPRTLYGKFDFKTVSRNPENYKGNKVKITGYVLQVLGSRSEGFDIRLATKGHYDNVVYIYILSDNTPDYNILEDDKLVVYATLDGDYTYTSTMGAEITLPLAMADSVEMAN